MYVRSGWIGVHRGMLEFAGRVDHNWPSVASDYGSAERAGAYNLHFHQATVYPSIGPYNRWYGFPIRCLAY